MATISYNFLDALAWRIYATFKDELGWSDADYPTPAAKLAAVKAEIWNSVKTRVVRHETKAAGHDAEDTQRATSESTFIES